MHIVDQILRMKTLFPQLKYRWNHKSREASWVGPLSVSDNHTTYTVRITYREGRSPRVYVCHPPLSKVFLTDPTAHIYRPGNHLCLYYPKNKEWLPSMSIAETIVPWAADWLLFYEDWEVTGTWRGGGIAHSDDIDQADSDDEQVPA